MHMAYFVAKSVGPGDPAMAACGEVFSQPLVSLIGTQTATPTQATDSRHKPQTLTRRQGDFAACDVMAGGDVLCCCDVIFCCCDVTVGCIVTGLT